MKNKAISIDRDRFARCAPEGRAVLPRDVEGDVRIVSSRVLIREEKERKEKERAT